MASTSPAPVILCGKTEQIARGVIELLKPEFEVIHLILTPEDGCVQIPLLLDGKEAPSDLTLGSKNYAATPVSVFAGAGYDEEALKSMMGACQGENIKAVPWLRPDTTKPAPPLGPEYGKALVSRIKEVMAELTTNGQINEMKLVWY